jgi:hypothetical protein
MENISKKTAKLTPEQKQEIKRRYWHDVRKTTGIAASIALVLGIVFLHGFFPFISIPFLVVFVSCGTFIISTYVFMSRMAKQYPELVRVRYGYQFTETETYNPCDPSDPLNWDNDWIYVPTNPNSITNPISDNYACRHSLSSYQNLHE